MIYQGNVPVPKNLDAMQQLEKYEILHDADGLASQSQRPVTDYEVLKTATNWQQWNKSVCACVQGMRPATKKPRAWAGTTNWLLSLYGLTTVKKWVEKGGGGEELLVSQYIS